MARRTFGALTLGDPEVGGEDSLASVRETDESCGGLNDSLYHFGVWLRYLIP